jgi:hypothetical protein
VTEDGELRRRTPFVQPVAPLVVSTAGAPTDALPPRLIDLLTQRLQERSTGVLILSSPLWKEHWGMEQIAAVLPLTEAVGPTARIKSRSRGTPAKDMMVPDVVKGLPFLTSIASAYAHGYRRMVVDASYTNFTDLLKYDDVLFFIGGHSLEADEAVMETVRLRGYDELEHIHARLVACAGVAPISVGSDTVHICDVFIPDDKVPLKGRGFGGVIDHVRKHRTIRWEDELKRLLDDGVLTPELVRASIEPRRGRTLDAALTKWAKRRARATA